MSGLFSEPSMPSAPPAAPPAPTAANSQGDLDIAARLQAEKLQRGRAATALTGGAGLSSVGSTAKILLGQ